MSRTFGLIAALVLSASAVSAQTITNHWMPGWDHVTEPLTLSKSNIKWSVAPATRKLTVTFMLVGATPNKLYQVGAHIYCTNAPGSFGQFPTNPASGLCGLITRQGVTAKIASVEMGVVTTDKHGTGSFRVIVGPIVSGSYDVEFTARDGAGCNLIGGSGNTNCAIDFQSPGPFGMHTTIVIP